MKIELKKLVRESRYAVDLIEAVIGPIADTALALQKEEVSRDDLQAHARGLLFDDVRRGEHFRMLFIRPAARSPQAEKSAIARVAKANRTDTRAIFDDAAALGVELEALLMHPRHVPARALKRVSRDLDALSLRAVRVADRAEDRVKVAVARARG